MRTITICDELAIGEIFNRFTMEVPAGEITIREIIRRRVFEEVDRYNSSMNEPFRGLVQPSEAELTLNGYRLREGRKIDPERQYELAVEAFQRNGFFMLIGDRQAESLDDRVEPNEDLTISFIKLVPLVGG